MKGLSVLLIYGWLLLGLQSEIFGFSTDPIQVFASTSNNYIPTKYWLNNKSPYPTNAWFINFALNNGTNSYSNPVNMFPYLV